MTSMTSLAQATDTASIIRLRFGLTESKLQRVNELGVHPEIHPEVLVEAFYAWMAKQPWKAAFFPRGVPPTVRSAQTQYWVDFLSGQVDDTYVAGRIRVGATHARIDLPAVAYTTAMAFSQRWLIEAARTAGLEADALLETVTAVGALCQLDTALVMDAYHIHSRRRVQEQADRFSAINEETRRIVMAASEGDFSLRYEAREGEDGSLAKAINQMVAGLESTVRQARAIAEGDFTETVVPHSDHDALGQVLYDMTKKLREATAQTERDHWLREGRTRLSDEMRGELSMADLGRAVVQSLGRRLSAPVATLYVVIDDELRLAGTYGISTERAEPVVAMGDGLLGEAAASRETHYDIDISDAPVRGTYGMGEVSLGHLAIVPLVAGHKLTAVLQLATKEPLTEPARQLLAMVSESVAIAVRVANGRERMTGLLERSRQQSEELQAQAEALRTSNEELEERSEELARARVDLERRNAELVAHQEEVDRAKTQLERRAEELATASKYKSEFLANMSHELRTPLNSMLILASSLAENRAGNLEDKQVEAARIIHGGGQDLLRLIEDILDLSKVEAGKLVIDAAPVSLTQVLESMRSQLQPVADQRGLELRITAHSRAPSRLETDRHRLEQVLKNLLSNSLKFTRRGHVELKVGEERDGHFSIRVSDTGIGIPEAVLQDVFEAFQQGDGSTRRAHGGTGLGLTISRDLAQLLGGRIEVESREGEGTSFTVTLPIVFSSSSASAPPKVVANEAARTPNKAPPSGPRISAPPRPTTPAKVTPPMTILVVEDDPDFSRLVADVVEKAGYRALITDSGIEAVVLAHREAPNGILLDLGLPDLDGMAVLEQLKSSLGTRHIPVHILSGHDCEKDAFELGAVGFVRKPTAEQKLVEVVQNFEAHWGERAKRILVVEDDFASQMAIGELLSGDGVELEIVETTSEAREALAWSTFDCMVLDLGLPDQDGIDFLEQLPQDHPAVVIYTAQQLDDDALERINERTERVVVKGACSPDRLIDEVSLFLHQVDHELPEAQRDLLHELYDASDPLKGKRVMVVDDDIRNVFAMTDLFQRHEMEVVKAEHGEAALERLAEDADIDLVIMDVMMPVMDGLTAMREIRANAKYASLPIVAVTAKTLPEDRAACLEAGASDYVTKPTDPYNLIALARVLLFDASRRSRGLRRVS